MGCAIGLQTIRGPGEHRRIMTNQEIRTANAAQMSKFLWKEGDKYTIEQLQSALANAFKKIAALERDVANLKGGSSGSIRT